MSDQPKKKVNKAKARLQRREEQMEQQRREAAQEAAMMPDLKTQESELMKTKISEMGLQEYNINADGHCLYSAFADQLSIRYNIAGTYKDLRKEAAQYIRDNPEAFQPFLLSDHTGKVPNIEEYADKVENSPRWGGEIEIIALARRYSVAVDVIQVKGMLLQFEEVHKNKVTLARYEHMYSLGAHYNSLRPIL